MTRRITRTGKPPSLNFTVTAAEIALAMPRDSGHCMIADALADAYPQARFISVDLATIRFSDVNAGWRYVYLTPRPAQDALLAFDNGEDVKPFRVNCRAAQMIETGTARKARSNAEPKPPGTATTRRRPPTPARLARANGGSVPVKVGGQLPPVGPLARGQHIESIGRRPNSRGKRREYGLRVYVK